MKLQPLKRTKSVVLGVVLATIVAGGGFDNASGQTETVAPVKKTKLRTNSYYYSAFNRRDPFKSLVVGDFVSDKKMSPIVLGRLDLVGIVRGELDRFALLEDNKGFSYILRVGDRVKNGSIVAIGEETMVARVTNFGQTRKVTLHMDKGEGDKQ
ncbi:MAG: hypothetical protein O7D32_09020 [bacterium]|nr:hypothetical protein [bacterium]